MKTRTKFLATAGMGLGLLLSTTAWSSNLDDWMDIQTDRCIDRVYEAISPDDGALGSVMASPSKREPNYYYHWIRDAALTMREVWAWRDADPQLAMETLWDYAHFSRENQLTDNLSGNHTDKGLGEPKFHMNGDAYNESWGRPQNDGPALRALVLMPFAKYLLDHGKESQVRKKLYNNDLPARTVIKADLEYVAHRWKDPSYDLWEEVEGDHFYTRITQWRALQMGTEFAKIMGDEGAEEFYHKQALKVHKSLEEFWNEKKGYYVATLNRTGGVDYKESGLDIAIILGVLHAGAKKGAFSVFDPRVLDTAIALEKTFQKLYSVNKIKKTRSGDVLAPAIGRYPEDTYNGVESGKQGNPWFLATHALAEFYAKRGEWDKAEAFILRSKTHSGENGRQSEQIDRNNGYMKGARDLTWSYASFLSLMRAYHP